MKVNFEKYILHFNKPVYTSRGELRSKTSYFIHLDDGVNKGVGECSIIPNLSVDNELFIENKIEEVSEFLRNEKSLDHLNWEDFPALKFAFETAMLDLSNGGEKILFKSKFTDGKLSIPINGLVWMGSTKQMFKEALTKIGEGYQVLKFKIGATNFDDELTLIRKIRDKCSGSIEIRLDANGAFKSSEVLMKLKQLEPLNIHSVEQPIKSEQWEEMASICKLSPIDIALDEELIGIKTYDKKNELLQYIKPQILILKPSLIGGLKEADDWINLAQKHNISWWATSALESNVGLNAIAQWVATKDTKLHQGLGTGLIYSNNFPTRLKILNGQLWYT